MYLINKKITTQMKKRRKNSKTRMAPRLNEKELLTLELLNTSYSKKNNLLTKKRKINRQNFKK
jgi:hypothetical protein